MITKGHVLAGFYGYLFLAVVASASKTVATKKLSIVLPYVMG